jgi:hypothetical protein
MKRFILKEWPLALALLFVASGVWAQDQVANEYKKAKQNSKSAVSTKKPVEVTYKNTMQEFRKMFNALYNEMWMDPEDYKSTLANRQDNELQPDKEGMDADFYYNPLLLNGKPLDYAKFSAGSKGTLTLVEGNPESPDARAIPFHIYLRRNGTILTMGASNPAAKVMSIDVQNVLNQAKVDDHLIIEPVRKRDWKAKRIIRVGLSWGC